MSRLVQFSIRYKHKKNELVPSSYSFVYIAGVTSCFGVFSLCVLLCLSKTRFYDGYNLTKNLLSPAKVKINAALHGSAYGLKETSALLQRCLLFAELNGEPFVFIGALIVFFPHFP